MYFGNRESRAKWQKTFIDGVFTHKTKISDSFSKIILNHIDLIEGKRSRPIPKSLFKFYKPTSENIQDIQKRRLWFSDPVTLNDPFDCHTGFDPENYEKHALVDYIQEHGCVEAGNSKNGFTIDELNILSESTTEYEYNNASRPEYRTLFWKLLKEKSEAFNQEVYGVLRQTSKEAEDKMTRLRSTNIRIACFSALDRYKGFKDMIQMWSHYTDNHRGFCVEYDTTPIHAPVDLSLKDTDFYSHQSAYMDERTRVALLAGLFPVIYTASRVNVPRTKLQRIKLDGKGNLQHDNDIDTILYKTYVVKSAKWNYEKEWRFILDGEVCNYYDNKVPFPYIKRIFLGCKMRDQTIDTMIEIAAEVGAEVIMMTMDPKKFLLEENSIESHRWNRQWSKWKNPYFG